MPDWILEYKELPQPDPQWAAFARKRLNEQTRPSGSLGFLETLLERLSAIQKKERLDLSKKRILIFAADHGVAAEGVSLYPKDVTQAMVRNFLAGGATVNALARQAGAEVCVIDMGVDADFENEPGLISRKIGRGTKNFSQEPAMTDIQLYQAIEAGWEMASQAARDGVQIVAVGEMGIGNTASASAVIAALTGEPAAAVTGRGTGLDSEGLQHKIRVIEKALEKHRAELKDPLDILRCVGGFEIAAMTGALLGAARHSLPVIADGWIVAASVLCAVEMNPRVLDYLFFAHESAEYGHRMLLERFEARTLLNLSMRLGEASGAALGFLILDAAVRVYNETATFSEAGVKDRVRD